MNFSWFHQLSSSELAIMVGTVTLVVALVGLSLTAHRVRETSLHEQLDNGAIAGILAALIEEDFLQSGEDGLIYRLGREAVQPVRGGHRQAASSSTFSITTVAPIGRLAAMSGMPTLWHA